MLVTFFLPGSAHAIKTASSFDLSWALAQLNLTAVQTSSTTPAIVKHLNSFTGMQLDYNVALFDFRTVATFSFTQFQTSNLGTTPISRIAFGASYHLFRINGQRVILDNQVEGKIWGISPAVELSVGVNKLSVKEPGNSNFDFTAGLLDAIPRLLIEVPITSTFLLMLRAGTYLTLQGATSQYKINLTGPIFNIGFKLTTL